MERSAQLNDKEIRRTKLLSSICLGFGLLIASTMSTYWWDLEQRAVAFDLAQIEA